MAMVDVRGGSMKIGTIVRYQYKYPDGMEMDWIGTVLDFDCKNVLVQWMSIDACGLRQWRQPRELEVICK
jgi:hypothetical protein